MNAFRDAHLRLGWCPIAGQPAAGHEYLIARVLSKFDEEGC